MGNPYNRPFAATLQEIDKGKLHVELTDALTEVVAGVMTVGKGGKLTLTLSIKPAAKRADMVLVAATVTKRVPEADRDESLFYATDDGGLSRRDPNQSELPGVLRPLEHAEEN